MTRHTNEAGDFALVDETGHIEIYRQRSMGFYELETSISALPEETEKLLMEFGFR